MTEIEIGLAVASSVVLFLFGIESFSAEIQAISGKRFRRFLARGTDNRFSGFTLGALTTAVIQSSTATSVIAVGLVNAGVLTFRQSLGVLFGANVGTTITAQLVALKLTDFAPALLLAGFVASLLPFRWRIFGRSIFYFGLVFFSLQLVSAAVEPLKSDPWLLGALASLDNPLLGIAVGALFTTLVQSSSVTTGVAIVLMSQGAIPLDAAIPLILGANVGTTSTSLIAAARLDTSARRTALSHGLYNLFGVLLFVPVLGWFAPALTGAGLTGAPALAMAHLIFNLVTAVLFLILLEPFARLVERLVPDDAGEERPLPPLQGSVIDDEGQVAVRRWASEVLRAQGRAYTAAVLALETRDSSIEARARRGEAMVAFALEEASSVVRAASGAQLEGKQSEAVLRLVITIDHLRQIQDSLSDLLAIGDRLEAHHARLPLDTILEIQAVYPVFSKTLEQLAIALTDGSFDEVRRRQEKVARHLQGAYRQFLVLVQGTDESGDLADFLSIHQRLRTKIAALVEFAIAGPNLGPPGPEDDPDAPAPATAPLPGS